MRKERSDKCWEIGVDSEMMMPVLQSLSVLVIHCVVPSEDRINCSHAR